MELYFDRSDFEESAGKEFFRLTATQPVYRLMVPHKPFSQGVKDGAELELMDILTW
ncbi:hypothetical protein LXG23DRAFT_55575 [Yarrowia lipolytica]|nr:hypothetical protein LXG23DRAFT_55575 [Yarrowia lipolytica]